MIRSASPRPSRFVRRGVVAALVLESMGLMIAGRALAADRNACVGYGPDFVAVDGSDTCVRVGGRIRVEAGNGSFNPNNGWASGGILPAAANPDLSPARRHIRLNDLSSASSDPFTR